MKEFIEKLIGRLEERKQLHNRVIAYEQKSGTVTEEFQQRKAVEVLDDVIKIVNQLAEEYNQDLDKLKQEPKTRIEHIHSMSVEEMADKILASEISTTIDFCQEFSECQDLNEKGEEIPDEMCKKCLVKWLNSPVEQQKVIPTKHFEDRFNTVT